MRILCSLCIALSTYSKIPTPRVEWNDENRRYSMCFFPVIGLAVGLLELLWLRLCDALALGGALRGAVAAVIPLFVTGGIHMDGFMDTCDALGSWQTRERRLEILKDPHAGAFAVIGCGAYLLLLAGVMSEADAGDGAALAPCFVLSRALSALALTCFKKAREDGMLAGFARAARHKALVGCCALWAALCLGALMLFAGARGALAFAAQLAVLAHYRRMAYREFGGVTGDLAGWFLQAAELCGCAVIVLGGKIG
ncbi:MAG: adenosylcobinamide-GDP ribazoletransferase [Clostridia bacterium]|nr:adenosylcobinamide-GDP ribazoletransferase [Clostridia bacterium]